MEAFYESVQTLQRSHATVLCLGLDPRPHYLTEADREAENPLAAWGERLLRETADYICCVKPNSAFYEAHGSYGWEALRQTIASAHAIGAARPAGCQAGGHRLDGGGVCGGGLP